MFKSCCCGCISIPAFLSASEAVESTVDVPHAAVAAAASATAAVGSPPSTDADAPPPLLNDSQHLSRLPDGAMCSATM